ncbi:hypothetical protein [Vulgatibacter sp.]|uniref:hypothetical protein n=1 Tax=Vulgatibacter sp. TaxID=1971226 RepID=UPI003563ABA0
MRCVTWEEFLSAGESILDEALRCGTPIYVRRHGEIVLEIMPTEQAEEAEEGGVTPSDRASIADRWCAAQLSSDNI